MYLYPPPIKRVKRVSYYRGVLYAEVSSENTGDMFHIETYNVIEDVYDEFISSPNRAEYFQKRLRHIQPTAYKENDIPPQWKEIEVK